MSKIIDLLVLPSEVSEFEAKYLARMNRIGLAFFAAHVPVLAIIAFFNDTGPMLAIGLATAVMLGPTLAYRAFSNPRAMSLAYGFTSMLMGGLLVHFGQGPVQIETHFYFFALLAMLVLFGNPMAIVVAAVTVAVHHFLLWLVLPRSVFNYDAALWVVAVHAGFVVLESVAACFIARSFFDNVIGFEKIVGLRTRELDDRNAELRRVLDNVEQGLLVLDRRAVVAAEKSAMVERWLGPIAADASFVDVLRSVDDAAAAWFEVGWAEVVEGTMPLELTLAQLPSKAMAGGRHLALAYIPITVTDDAFAKLLVVVSDVSAEVERARLEAEQRELLTLFNRLVDDRRGVIEFLEEVTELVATVTDDPQPAMEVLRRKLHTIKGNAAIFGAGSIVDICHALETSLADGEQALRDGLRRALADRWATLHESLGPLLGHASAEVIEVERRGYEAVLTALRGRRPHGEIEREIEGWALAPAAVRLERIAAQARRIAQRLGKGQLDVEIRHNDLRFPPDAWSGFWSAFVHAVRNAVDHGIESPEHRRALGKPELGRIILSTTRQGDMTVVAIEDDGRGLDLDALSAAARRAGLATTTADEIRDAMFVDGVSTKGAVSEFSGRGIGMGAVRAACEALGGTVVCRSEPNRFTRCEFHLPSPAGDTSGELAA
jgi:two-component system, chemotaxis family, sensor kinase CheA